jgi:signal transduction histidine kinase
MSNDLLKDLRENIDNNKEKIDEEDYEDTLDVLVMLAENLQHVDKYGQNTTRILKAMEEMLKDRTGGYVDMDLLPVLQQNEEMLNKYYDKEKEEYHIKMSFGLPTVALPLHGNPDMLSKTIMSLLGNAVYAVVKKARRTPYAPEISFTVTVSDNHYILKIRDNGIGIEEKIINKVFDPFFTTKTTGEAAGVGLYLSREIIQNHGGDISVDSVKDEYTEFTITLPSLPEMSGRVSEKQV